MPNDLIVTIGFVLIALLLGAAMVISIRRLALGRAGNLNVERTVDAAALILAAALLTYRAATLHSWTPLRNHADGLLLMTALLSALLIYLHWGGRLRGVELFARPIAVVLALWGVCASWWSFKPFSMMSTWTVMHLVSVYVGLGAVVLAAGSGALYLFVQRQLRHSDHAVRRFRLLGRLASLERVEKTVIVTATVGFALVTLAVATGLVSELSSEQWLLGQPWWRSPKVLLSAAAWAVYAVIMHVNFAPTFRGARAAVLSIVGLVLWLIVLGIALTLSGCARYDKRVMIGSDPTVFEDTAETLPPPPPSEGR